MTQYLTFDIGGTNLKYALIDEERKIFEKDRVETNTESLEAFMQSIYQVADKYQGKYRGIAAALAEQWHGELQDIDDGVRLPLEPALVAE